MVGSCRVFSSLKILLRKHFGGPYPDSSPDHFLLSILKWFINIWYDGIMLRKRYRFHSRGGVRYVYQKGKTVRSPKMSLVYTENARGFTRVAVVISKKVEKSAVKRNRVRRRVYEAIRLNINKLPKATDYVFVVFSREVGRMRFSELEKLLGELVKEVKVCYNKER